MGIIQTIGTQIDEATTDYLQAVFTGVAEPVQTLMMAIGLTTLLFIAINHVVQAQQIHYSRYLNWAITYILVVSFATVWGNFSAIYDALTSITQDYSNLVVEAVAKDIETLRSDILNPANITGAGDAKTYAALDEFGHAIVWIAGDFFRDTSILDLGKTFRNIFAGLFVLIVGGIFIAASAVMVLIAKVGLILGISLAPLGIMMFMWEKTRHYFQGWVSLLIGFAVIPLLLGCLMAIVLYFAGHILATSGASSLDKGKFFGFIFIMIAALVLLFHIPTMAQTIASASVTVGGAGLARGMTNAASRMSGVAALKQYLQALPQRAAGQMFDPRKYAHAGAAALGAARAGASPKDMLVSGYSAFRRHADERKAFWRNRREQAVLGPAQMSPNPAYRGSPSKSGPFSSESSESSGGKSTSISPEQRDLYKA